MDKKYSTIQELENIKLKDFKDKPLELVRIGKDLLNAKRFEKSIEVFEEALIQMIKLNNNDELSIECAKFYYYYADAIIYKLQENGEMLHSEVIKKNEEVKEFPSENNNFQKKIPNIINEDEIEIKTIQNENDNNVANKFIIDENDYEQEDSNAEEEEEDDEKVAFDHLAISENILQSFLKKYEGIPAKELPPKIVDYFLDLSDIFLKYGELEQIKSDFKKACEFYYQSLHYKNMYDDKYSRAVAEVYYMIGNAADFDAKKALSCLYKTFLILMKHLRKEYKEEIQINIEFEDVKIEELKIDCEIYRELIDDTEAIKDLKEIMRDLSLKIEDVVEEVKIMDLILKEKIGIKKEEFSKNYEDKTLIDLNKSGIIKKRTREEINQINGNDNTSSGKMAKITENGKSVIIETPIGLNKQQNPGSKEKNEIKKETEEK